MGKNTFVVVDCTWNHILYSPPLAAPVRHQFLRTSTGSSDQFGERRARVCVCHRVSELVLEQTGRFQVSFWKISGDFGRGGGVKSIRRREHFKRFNKSFFFADTKGWLGRFLPLSGVTGNATWLGPHYSGLSLLWRHQPPRLKVVETRRRKYRCLLSNVEGKKKKKSQIRAEDIEYSQAPEKKNKKIDVLKSTGSKRTEIAWVTSSFVSLQIRYAPIPQIRLAQIIQCLKELPFNNTAMHCGG